MAPSSTVTTKRGTDSPGIVMQTPGAKIELPAVQRTGDDVALDAAVTEIAALVGALVAQGEISSPPRKRHVETLFRTSSTPPSGSAASQHFGRGSPLTPPPMGRGVPTSSRQEGVFWAFP
jgi:hypothetical protein